MDEKLTIPHKKALFEVRQSCSGDITFQNGEPILDIAYSRNGGNWSCLTPFNRTDLVNLRDAIDAYLTKTVPQPNYD